MPKRQSQESDRASHREEQQSGSQYISTYSSGSHCDCEGMGLDFGEKGRKEVNILRRREGWEEDLAEWSPLPT